MTQDKFSEVRLHPRRKTEGPLPGKIFLKRSRREVKCQPFDVSDGGLSILSEQDILPETDLVFVIDQHEVQLELVWGLSNYKDTGCYRYGLRTINSTLELDSLFRNSGC